MPLAVRAGPRLVVAALVVLGACSSGDRTSFGPPLTTTTGVTTTVPTTTSTTAAVTDPAGSVTLRVTDFTLPDLRSGGTGLRLVVRSSAPRLTVRRRGG